MTRNTHLLDYYVIDGTKRHINLVVPDKTQAWLCAKDVKSWLKIYGISEGTVSHVSGSPGRIGVCYMRTQTVVYEGVAEGGPGDGKEAGELNGTRVEQHHLFEKYTLKGIDEENMKLSFEVELGGDAAPEEDGEVKQMILQVDSEPKVDGKFIVKYTQTGYLNGTDFQSAIPCCCCLVSCLNAQLKEDILETVGTLQRHYTSYVPETGPKASELPRPTPTRGLSKLDLIPVKEERKKTSHLSITKATL